MKKLTLVALAAGLATAAIADAATGWRVVRSKSVTGQFAITSISAEINRPKPRGMAVRLIGRVSSGTGIISCSKGFDVAAWSRSYGRAGLYVLPMTPGADSCSVTAAVGGSGRVTVQILRR